MGVYVERLMATKTMKCLLRLSLFTHRNFPIQLVRSHRRSCSNKSDDSVRIVFISDTHSYHHQLPSLPHGDILIHAGDFTERRPPRAEGNKDNFMDTNTSKKHDLQSGFWRHQVQEYVKEG